MAWSTSPPPRTGLALRRSLIMGLGCGLVGLAVGAWVACTAIGEGYASMLLAAPLGAFLAGFLFWFALVARNPAPGRLRPVAAGVLAGIVGHWICLYLLILLQNLRYLWLGETDSLGGPPMDPLNGLWGAAVLSFWSLVMFGWLTAPVGGLLGFLLSRVQFRRKATGVR